MNDMEKMLKREKERIEILQAPEGLEERLHMALADRKRPKKRFPLVWKTVVAAAIIFLFVSYNFNALAYYGKRILGFDEVLSGTLKDLNEAGMGQIIHETLQLSDGTEITLNGLMSDENRLIIYYTMLNPDGIEDSYHLFHPKRVTGLFTNADYQGGSGMTNDSETELKGMMEFDPPSPFAKKLTLRYWETDGNGQLTEYQMSFDYDPNQAMDTVIEQSINEKFKVDQGTIQLDSIKASPTLTVISGTTNFRNVDTVTGGLEGFELLANGEPIQIYGSGISSSLTGTKIELKYDALPNDLHSLQLKLNRFSGKDEVKKSFPLKEEKKEFQISDELLSIKSIKVNNGVTEVTIQTNEYVRFDEVYLGDSADGVQLDRTVDEKYTKTPDGKVLKERTLLFNTNQEIERLYIGEINYMKAYNHSIEIPID